MINLFYLRNIDVAKIYILNLIKSHKYDKNNNII